MEPRRKLSARHSALPEEERRSNDVWHPGCWSARTSHDTREHGNIQSRPTATGDPRAVKAEGEHLLEARDTSLCPEQVVQFKRFRSHAEYW